MAAKKKAAKKVDEKHVEALDWVRKRGLEGSFQASDLALRARRSHGVTAADVKLAKEMVDAKLIRKIGDSRKEPVYALTDAGRKAAPSE